MRKLTIGMATFDDYDGVYFSLQSIRLHHPEVLNDIEFVIIDNNPTSEHGKAIRSLITHIKEPVQYLPFTNYNSTIVRNKIFELADTPYVLSIDSHVLLVPNSLKKLIDYYDKNKDRGNLLQGPLLYDDMNHISTHFDLTKWGGYMWGQWGTDDRAYDENAKPFEIQAQGLGLFSCRKDSWLKFNPHFRGFGGEEGYIHEKYRKSGKKTICLPFLRWLHRFNRPNGVPYNNNLNDRFRNYFIGHTELGLPKDDLLQAFPQLANEENIKKLEEECKELQIS